MTATRWARLIALLVSVSTFIFLFLHDSWRADNLFLVPDLVFCALLLVAGLLPHRHAVPALLVSLPLAAGVLMSSVASYAVRGELGLPSLIGVIACLATAAVLAWQQTPRAVKP